MYCNEFESALKNKGINPSKSIDIKGGKVYRFHIKGDKPGTKNGWYHVKKSYPLEVQFGSWKRGNDKEVWKSKAIKLPTQSPRTRATLPFANRSRDIAAKKAKRIWNRSSPAKDSHKYLRKKCVSANKLKVSDGGKLIIPLKNSAGKIRSYQTIDTNGEKRFLKNGEKKGLFHMLGKPSDVICIAEGYATSATIYEAMEKTTAVAIAFDAGNMLAVAENLRKMHPKAKIILCADNDDLGTRNIGKESAQRAAEAINGYIAIPFWSGDFNDRLKRDDSHKMRKQAYEEIREIIENSACTIRRLQSYSLAEIPNLPPRKPLIQGLLDCGTMSVIYGEQNSGKTFFALDLAYHVAQGANWQHLKTKKGVVIYIAAEAGLGIQERLEALSIKFDSRKGKNFRLIPSSVNLAAATGDAEEIIKECELLSGRLERCVTLIVIDTLSRALAGANENSSDAMGTLIMNCDRIREKTGAHVMLVHHVGKSIGRGPRGHSALSAAADTEIEIVQKGQKIQATVKKQRDAENGNKFTFSREVIPLNDERRTSCILHPVENSEGIGTSIGDVSEYLDCLNRLSKSQKNKGIPIQTFRCEFAKIYQTKRETIQVGSLNKACKRMLEKMEKAEFIKMKMDLIYLL